MKRILFLLSFLCTLSAAAQNQVPVLWLLNSDTTASRYAGILDVQANFNIGSNFLDRTVMDPMLFGGTIERADLERVVSKMPSYGKGRGEFGITANYYGGLDSLFGRKDWGLYLHGEAWSEADLGINKDAFALASLGNVNYVGQRVDFSSTNYHSQSLRALGVGWYNKKTYTGVSLSMVSGMNYREFSSGSSSFYTSLMADTLELVYRGTYYASSNKQVGANGVGFSLDAQYNVPFAKDKGWFSVNLRHLGAVAWNGQSTMTQFDSTLTWTGVNLNHLLQTDSILNGGSLNTDSLSLHKHYQSSWKPLSPSVSFRLFREYNAGKSIYYGIQYWIYDNVIPQLHAGAMKRWENGWAISSQVGYGGFGKLKWGMEVQYFNPNGFYFSVGTTQLPGYFFTHTHEVQGQVRLTYLINKRKKE